MDKDEMPQPLPSILSLFVLEQRHIFTDCDALLDHTLPYDSRYT